MGLDDTLGWLDDRELVGARLGLDDSLSSFDDRKLGTIEKAPNLVLGAEDGSLVRFV